MGGFSLIPHPSTFYIKLGKVVELETKSFKQKGVEKFMFSEGRLQIGYTTKDLLQKARE